MRLSARFSLASSQHKNFYGFSTRYSSSQVVFFVYLFVVVVVVVGICINTSPRCSVCVYVYWKTMPKPGKRERMQCIHFTNFAAVLALFCLLFIIFVGCYGTHILSARNYLIRAMLIHFLIGKRWWALARATSAKHCKSEPIFDKDKVFVQHKHTHANTLNHTASKLQLLQWKEMKILNNFCICQFSNMWNVIISVFILCMQHGYVRNTLARILGEKFSNFSHRLFGCHTFFYSFLFEFGIGKRNREKT